MHEPYEQKLKHQPDFRVKYKFRAHEDGGRKNLPYQGLRCDFSFADGPTIRYILFGPNSKTRRGMLS